MLGIQDLGAQPYTQDRLARRSEVDEPHVQHLLEFVEIQARLLEQHIQVAGQRSGPICSRNAPEVPRSSLIRGLVVSSVPGAGNDAQLEVAQIPTLGRRAPAANARASELRVIPVRSAVEGLHQPVDRHAHVIEVGSGVLVPQVERQTDRVDR